MKPVAKYQKLQFLESPLEAGFNVLYSMNVQRRETLQKTLEANR